MASGKVGGRTGEEQRSSGAQLTDDEVASLATWMERYRDQGSAAGRRSVELEALRAVSPLAQEVQRSRTTSGRGQVYEFPRLGEVPRLRDELRDVRADLAVAKLSERGLLERLQSMRADRDQLQSQLSAALERLALEVAPRRARQRRIAGVVCAVALLAGAGVALLWVMGVL